MKKLILMALVFGSLQQTQLVVAETTTSSSVNGMEALQKAVKTYGDVQLLMDIFKSGYVDADKVKHPNALEEVKDKLKIAQDSDNETIERGRAVAQLFKAGTYPLSQLAVVLKDILAVLHELGDKGKSIEDKLADPVAKMSNVVNAMYANAKILEGLIPTKPKPVEPGEPEELF